MIFQYKACLPSGDPLNPHQSSFAHSPQPPFHSIDELHGRLTLKPEANDRQANVQKASYDWRLMRVETLPSSALMPHPVRCNGKSRGYGGVDGEGWAMVRGLCMDSVVNCNYFYCNLISGQYPRITSTAFGHIHYRIYGNYSLNNMMCIIMLLL